jgi:hypothetical protein
MALCDYNQLYLAIIVIVFIWDQKNRIKLTYEHPQSDPTWIQE